RPRKRNLLMAMEARNANTRHTATESRVTATLTPSAAKNDGVSTRSKFFRLPPTGKNVGVAASRVTVDSIDELTIQYTGNAHATASTRARALSSQTAGRNRLLLRVDAAGAGVSRVRSADRSATMAVMMSPP